MKQARKTFAMLLLEVSRDMRSIAAGPLRWQHDCIVTICTGNRCGERQNESKGQKAMRAMSENSEGDAENTHRERSQRYPDLGGHKQ